ncbi:hypothetical protein ACFLT8_06515 [Chloroflexota bacterium]
MAIEHDVGFIAMKPLAGVMLDNVTIAFKYVIQFSGVVSLVGIKKIHEIDEIIRVFVGPWVMNEEERCEMQRLNSELGTRFCRRCDYCQTCTEGIPISMVMDTKSMLKRAPPEFILSGRVADGLDKATNYTKCGECEERYPHSLPIMELLEEYVSLHQVEQLNYQKQRV